MEDEENVVYCDVLDIPRPPALPPPRHKENVADSGVLDVPRSPPQLPPRVQLPPERLSSRLSPLHFPRQPTISQNNNRCCRNTSLSKRSMALVFAVAFFAILSTVFAVMNFTIDKKYKTSGSACVDHNDLDTKQRKPMNTTEQKRNGSSGSWKYLGYGCVGAKDNQYLQLTYSGPSVFIGAVKLVHRNGTVGNHPSRSSYWGGAVERILDLAMVVTDLKNRVIYPSPRLVTIHTGGWYSLPGYSSTSPELVLSDFQNPKYLRKGEKIRIWYGEDMYDYGDWNNHGKTCMYVYVYST